MTSTVQEIMLPVYLDLNNTTLSNWQLIKRALIQGLVESKIKTQKLGFINRADNQLTIIQGF